MSSRAGSPGDTELFRELRAHPSDARREDLYRMLIDRYRWLVRWAANRYDHPGEHSDDLTQVGYLGLVEAVERFDPDRGVDFVSFARPTILGEIRRHFRDRRRWIRLPRRIQELKLQLRQATDELSQLGHAPTVAELADHLGVTEDEVSEALDADDTFAPLSLNISIGVEDETTTYLDQLADKDTDVDDLIDTASLWALLERLPERERQMILLRFYGNKTQAEIAARLGISQMHVSRLLAQTLRSLRNDLVA